MALSCKSTDMTPIQRPSCGSEPRGVPSQWSYCFTQGTNLASATVEYLWSRFLYTATWLLAMRSWAMRTFSLPLTTK